MSRVGGRGRDPAPDQAAGAARRVGRWSSLELMRLRERFVNTAPERLARQLGRSVEAVLRRGLELCAPARPRSGSWSDADTEVLWAALGIHDEATVAALLGRSREDLEQRLVELAATPRRGPWTRAELRHLRRAYGTRSDEALALGLGRAVDDVRAQAEELALGKDKAEPRVRLANGARRMPRWSTGELAELRRRYPDEDNLSLARSLGRSVQSIASKASELGISKSSAALRAMGRRNVTHRGLRGSRPSHGADS